MPMMKAVTLRRRVWLVSSLLGLAVLVMLFVGSVVTMRLATAQTGSRIATEALRNHLEADMMHDALRSQVYQAAYAARAGDVAGLRAVQAEYTKHLAWFRKMIAANAALPLPDKVGALLRAVDAPLKIYVDDSSALISVAMAGRELPSADLARFGDDFALLEDALKRTSDAIEQTVIEDGDQVASLTSIWRWMLAASALLFLGLAGWIMWTLQRNVVDPLGRLTSALGRLSNGDLDVEVADRDRGDEIGTLAKGLEAFKSAVREARDAEQRSRDDRNRSEEAIRRSDDAVRLAEAQADRRAELEQMATALEERVLATAQLIGESCRMQQQAADTMSERALTTREDAAIATAATDRSAGTAHVVVTATRQLSTAINEVSNRMIAASATTRLISERAADGRDNVLLLDQAAARIGDFSTLIANVARKTNMLAINATIEAARAGDGGRGFSVVASEVKSLAAQIGLATQQISEQIGDVRRTAGAVSCSISDMRSAVRVLDDSAASIVTAIDQQSEAIGEIDRTVHLSVEGIDGLRRIMDGVEQQVETTREISEDIATTARTLEQQGTSLIREVSDFIDRVRAA